MKDKIVAAVLCGLLLAAVIALSVAWQAYKCEGSVHWWACVLTR